MLYQDVCIKVQDKGDFDEVIEAVKSNGVKGPIFIVHHPQSFEISYEANDLYESIEYVLERKFSQYIATEHLDVGILSIPLSIYVSQSPSSTDDWGRPINSDTIRKIVYFTERSATTSFPSSTKLLVLTETAEKEYDIYITGVIHVDKERSGYLATSIPFEEKVAPAFIVKKLFNTSQEALAEAIFKMKTDLGKEYDEEKKQGKGRRGKNK